MSEFKFEFELNPTLRASAALDNEGQRISDNLDRARRSFRSELRRIIAGIAIMSIALIVFGLYSASPHMSPAWILETILVLLGFSFVRGRGGVARLVELGRDARTAKKQLADWHAIRRDLSSGPNVVSQGACLPEERHGE